MNREDVVEMLRELLEEIDYDISKQYHPETAENPYEADANFSTLMNIVDKYAKIEE